VNAVRFPPWFPLSGSPCLQSNSSLELSKELPPHRYHFVRPLPKSIRLTPSRSLRPVDTIEPIRSAPAVSHDLDVLLRTELRRSIAPCNQSGVQPVSDLILAPRQTNLNQPTGILRIEPKFSSSNTRATRFLTTVRRRDINSRMVSKSRTRARSHDCTTLRSFPLVLSRSRVTIILHVSMQFDITIWPTPLVVIRCALPSESTKTVASPDFSCSPGHLSQPQGCEPSPSPLHQHAVADTPMPDTPLGFSDTGSPVP